MVFKHGSRTNWRWGKSDINILMLGIVFKGTAIQFTGCCWISEVIPILGKERHCVQMFIEHFGKNCIKGILADRSLSGKATGLDAIEGKNSISHQN